MRNVLLWSIYLTWVGEGVIRKRLGNVNKLLQSTVAKRMLTIHKIEAKTIHDSMITSIKSVVECDNALDYRRKLAKHWKQFTVERIRAYLNYINEMANLEQRALAIISSYDHRLRRIRRIASGKVGHYTPKNLLVDDITAIETKYKTPIKLKDRYKLAKFSGVNITDFYWDPRCVRTLWTMVGVRLPVGSSSSGKGSFSRDGKYISSMFGDGKGHGE